jgi:hypothetical protein
VSIRNYQSLRTTNEICPGNEPDLLDIERIIEKSSSLRIVDLSLEHFPHESVEIAASLVGNDSAERPGQSEDRDVTDQLDKEVVCDFGEFDVLVCDAQ